MGWFAPIDFYCERAGAGLWDEPLNALRNLGFPLVALCAWLTARRLDQTRLIVAILCVLEAMIGFGSFLFHTFANHWSEYAEVVPIWNFVGLYVLTAIALVGGAPPARLVRIAIIAGVVTIVVVFCHNGRRSGRRGSQP